ncbi:MAG TPA: lytic transglycosylase domain-containing protein [Candidatus Angelobacter sp.]|nr:lytic transglycosylase domain-containing protein [Candidatus Angelobacter sp.]
MKYKKSIRPAHSPQLGDVQTIDLRTTIINTANQAGVPAAIALAVATRESGIMQWRPDGSLVKGAAGEIGIFQLMPDTAAQLGVDPEDPLQNIQGGIRQLAQMYAQFGSWPLALAAYNWGPGNVSRQIAAGKTLCNFPNSVQNYVSFVLGAGVLAQCALSITAQRSTSSSSGTAPNSPGLIFNPEIAAADVDAAPSSGLSSGAVVATAAFGTFGLLWALFE